MTVIDASVALKAVFAEDFVADALAVMEEPGLQAPAFIDVEAAGAIGRRAGKGELRGEEADFLLKTFRRLPIRREPDAGLLAEALALSVRLSHSVYDCMYLALAIRSGDELVTADERLARAARRGGHGGRLRFLGADQP